MKNGRIVRNIALIVASGLLWPAPVVRAAEPPPDLLRKIAAREMENARARQNYTYRQSVTVQELTTQGNVMGQYHEVWDVIYSPNLGRSEKVIQPPRNTLTRVKLTPEDFADIRNIQSFLLTPDQVSLYEGKYKGEETIDGEPCFVEYIRPRQILSKQRFFEGILWVRQSDLAVIRSEGHAVPQIETLREQNLFPHFTTVRRTIDNQWTFPVETYGDDTLFFRNWPQRIRIVIRYTNYKRFEAESTVTYGDPSSSQPSQPAQPVTPPPKKE